MEEKEARIEGPSAREEGGEGDLHSRSGETCILTGSLQECGRGGREGARAG